MRKLKRVCSFWFHKGISFISSYSCLIAYSPSSSIIFVISFVCEHTTRASTYPLIWPLFSITISIYVQHNFICICWLQFYNFNSICWLQVIKDQTDWPYTTNYVYQFIISLSLIYWKTYFRCIWWQMGFMLLLTFFFIFQKGNSCCFSMVSCTWFPLHVCYYLGTRVQEWYFWRAKWAYWSVHGPSNNCIVSM